MSTLFAEGPSSVFSHSCMIYGSPVGFFSLIFMFGYLCLSFRKEVAVDNSRLVNRNPIASLQAGPNRPTLKQLCFPFSSL
jgi:hypothetical protein